MQELAGWKWKERLGVPRQLPVLGKYRASNMWRVSGADRADVLEEDETGADSQKRIDLEGGKREITSAEVALLTRSGGSLVVLQVNC